MFSRRAVTGIATAIALAAAAGCGSSSSSSSSSSAAASGGSTSTSSAAAKSSSGGPPIKLGAVVTLSGPFAQIGQSHEAGAQLAVQQINAAGGVLGRKLQLTVKDEQADPNATVSAVRDLLGGGTKLLFGGTTDPDCLGAAPLVNTEGGVMIGTSCQTNLLEGSKFVPAFFEIAPNNYMLSQATARVASQDFPQIKTWDGISPDYEFGHEVWTSFRQDLTKLDPSVQYRKGVFVPLTETQFNSYITSLVSGLPSNSATTTGLFMSTFSATTAGLAKQGKSYNLFGRYKAVLNLGGSTPTAQALGADTPPLWFIYDYYDGAYHNATNTKFVTAYKSAHGGQAPNAWAYEGYTAVLAYAAAVQKAGSDDPDKVKTALAGLTFDTPKGSLTFRSADHLLQSPVTVWKVQGDSSAPGGFNITNSQTVPASEVLPPAQAH